MTLRDTLVQLGFVMATAGAMLAAWAVFTGQFRRASAEPDEEAEPLPTATEPEPASAEAPDTLPVRTRRAPTRRTEQAARAAAGRTPRSRTKKPLPPS